ncbi:MAG: 4a-hydroxytetrahydrobiopterin dehydratase [Streptosporangiaceae bacterium]|nr:4a-hydroxytetrahydrobiopterin dehydratase [Streptosporangiaceae bacterium]
MADSRLKRQEISAAVSGLGWRLLLGELVTQVRTESLAQAADVAARLSSGIESGGHLRIDLRPDRLYLSLRPPEVTFVTARDMELARAIATAVTELGLTMDSGVGAMAYRSVQLIEIGIDALDIPAIRPFWKAVFGYTDDPGADGTAAAIIDPAGQGPSIWFQQMDAPRPQRNRIHFDISVPHDEAQRRIEAATAAGGTVIYDAEAPAFWVLADAEGNEACICTWQGRDP